MTGPRPLDLAVLVVYLAGVVGWGIWLGRGTRSGRDYFLGGRALPWPAVLLSIVATETSALTFLSVPGVAYTGDLGFLQLAMGYIVGRFAAAALLFPRYWEGRLATAYQMLESRFGRPVRRLTSGVFLLTRLLADSVRLFVTALPLALFTGLSVPVAVGIVAAATLAYTWVGGIRSVVWVDTLQMALYVAGGLAVAVALHGAVAGGWEAILGQAAAAGKTSLVELSFDPGVAYTLPAGILGGAFLSLASHGTDQLMVQRLLSCRDLSASRKALVGSGFAVFFQFALFLFLGLGLWVFYQGQAFERPDEVLATFVVRELPPGVTGLLVAGVFAVAMSSLSSSINSLASAATYDFFDPGAEPDDPEDAEDPGLLRRGRLLTALFAVLLAGGALLFLPMSRDAAAVEVALGITSLVYGGLLGAFLLAVVRPEVGGRAAAIAMGCGIASVTAVWLLARDALAWPWFAVVGSAVTVAVGLLLGALPGAGGSEARDGGDGGTGDV